MTEFRAACIQLCTGADPQENIRALNDYIDEAANGGADLVMTPETCNFMARGKARAAMTVPEQDDPVLRALREKAAMHGIWLLAGSLVVAQNSADAGEASGQKAVNRSVLLSSTGEVVARYDKIHLFDVTLGTGEKHFESRHYAAGDKAVLADLPWGRLGMTVCYDVRFPELYKMLAGAGADFLTVPSAFTRPTGAAHWHVLLRSRAIETGCFVFAPAQSGEHENGRETYGHSLIVDPWGEVLADAGLEPGVIYADIKKERVTKAREQIPSLKHDRAFHLPDDEV